MNRRDSMSRDTRLSLPSNQSGVDPRWCQYGWNIHWYWGLLFRVSSSSILGSWTSASASVLVSVQMIRPGCQNVVVVWHNNF